MGFNPFLVRASVYCWWTRARRAPKPAVPGFNPFLVRASVYCRTVASKTRNQVFRFNPFLVRASVYCGMSSRWMTPCNPYLFQSLLSQGISLLGDATLRRRGGGARSFNPFLVRASVYWCGSSTGKISLFAQCFNPFLVRASVYWVEAELTDQYIDPHVSIPS